VFRFCFCWRGFLRVVSDRKTRSSCMTRTKFHGSWAEAKVPLYSRTLVAQKQNKMRLDTVGIILTDLMTNLVGAAPGGLNDNMYPELVLEACRRVQIMIVCALDRAFVLASSTCHFVNLLQ